MATSKAKDDRLLVVCYGDGGTMFSQTTTSHLAEGGTLGWMLAGRAYIAGHKAPRVTIYRNGEPLHISRPSHLQTQSRFNGGRRFWELEGADNGNA